MSVLVLLKRTAARSVDWASRRFLSLCIGLGRGLTRRRLARDRVRTLWGTTPIITLPLKARADKALGFRSESLVFTTYYITRSFSWNLSLLARAFNVWPTASQAGYRFVLGTALLRYDIFHYFADRGILPSNGRRFGIEPQELEAIRQSGKSVYVFAYGADVRTEAATRALGRWNFCVDCKDPGAHCICDDTTGQALMRDTAALANGLVSMGDMLTYMPGAHHLSYWPVDLDAIKPSPSRPGHGPLRIAHAPNHTNFKGTRYLEASIARLAERGIAIELVRISGVPNAEVLRLFADSDLVADQFIGGAYGYTALEALAAAKPVLTYVRSPELALASEECPFIMATPDTLDEVLSWCATNRDALDTIGRQGRVYVARHHAIDAVAGRFAKLYRETAGLPDAINQRLAHFERREAARRDGIAGIEGWQHPWRLTEVRSDA